MQVVFGVAQIWPQPLGQQIRPSEQSASPVQSSTQIPSTLLEVRGQSGLIAGVPVGRVEVPVGRVEVPVGRVKVPVGRVEVPVGRVIGRVEVGRVAVVGMVGGLAAS